MRFEPETLRRIVEGMQGHRVLVVGDLMIDEYLTGSCKRISAEAPVPVVRLKQRTLTPGGAANTARNLLALGGKVSIAGVVGGDEMGETLKKLLEEKGVDISGIITDPGRPTTVKTRIVAQNQQLVRVDLEEPGKIEGAPAEKLVSAVVDKIKSAEGILISDYNKGVITPTLMGPLLTETKTRSKIVVVDPKPVNINLYKGVTLITPNQSEAGQASGIEITDEASLLKSGRALMDNLRPEAVLITRGEDGMSLFTGDGHVRHIPTITSEVYDVTGAGDTVVSVLTLALASGAPIPESTVISNIAAGIVVRKVGTATTSIEEILGTIFMRGV